MVIYAKNSFMALKSTKINPPESTPENTAGYFTPATENFNELLTRVGQNRDKQAFIQLFNHFAPRLKSFLMKGGAAPNDAEELAQETMLTIWDKAISYNQEQAAASTWIFTIARNKRIDSLRKIKFHANDPMPVLESIKDEKVPNPEGVLSDKVTHIRMDQALKALPSEQADLIRMSFFEDMAHADIAQKTKLPLGTVKSRIRLALERLRKLTNAADFGR